MELIFQNPALLYGAAGGAAPILIHLLNRRKAKPRRFPSITLIVESQKKVARHYRLKQLLLLALRVLSILAVAFFLAGPRLITGGVMEAGLEDTAVIIIIDNSFSMNYQTDEGTRLKLAKSLAGELMGSLHPQARLSVVPLIGGEQYDWTLSPDAEAALKAMQKIEVNYGPSDMSVALNRAYASLIEQPGEYRKYIILLTDMTGGPWKGFSPADLNLVDSSVELKIVGVANEVKNSNISITGLTSSYPIEGQPMVITVGLKSSPEARPGPLNLELQVDGRTVRRKVFKKVSRKNATVQLEYTPTRQGLHEGKLIVSDDRLGDDNQYFYTLMVKGKTDVLVVDGDPKTSLLNSETYYLTNALDPGPSYAYSPLAPRVVTTKEFNRMDHHEADVIILANVEGVTERTRVRLMDYVREGGNLIFFLGDKVDIDEYNSDFHDSSTRLLPSRLKEAAEAPARLWHIDRLDLAHPALSQFRGEDGESLFTAKFNRLIKVSPEGFDTNLKKLLTLDNGMPLLLEKKVGQGNVLLFTSSADRDWNDLCAKGAYLPLIQGLIRYLTTDGLQTPPSAGDAGGRVELPISGIEAGSKVELTGPRGDKLEAVVFNKGNRTMLSFTGTVPGFYSVQLPHGSRTVALNVSDEESDLTPISPGELSAKLEELNMMVVSNPTGAQEVLGGTGKNLRLSSTLVLTMFLLLAAEGLLSNKT